jgi:hypothetical protein
VAAPITFSSELVEPPSENGLVWIALTATALDHLVSGILARGPRICQAVKIIEGLDPVMYRQQLGPQPVTQKPNGGMPPSVPVCDPSQATCRHLQSLLLELTRRQATQKATAPVDLTDSLATLEAALGTAIAFFDVILGQNVSLLAKAKDLPRRPETPFPLQPPIPGATPPWDAGISIHPAIIDATITSELNSAIQLIQSGLSSDMNLDASIDSITFDVATQSVVVLLTAVFSGKHKYDVLLGTVTMRVKETEQLLIRVMPVVAGTQITLQIRQESVQSHHEDVSFEPEIVDVWSDPMKDYIKSVVALFALMAPKLSIDKTIQFGPTVAKAGFQLGSDRLIVYVTFV